MDEETKYWKGITRKVSYVLAGLMGITTLVSAGSFAYKGYKIHSALTEEWEGLIDFRPVEREDLYTVKSLCEGKGFRLKSIFSEHTLLTYDPEEGLSVIDIGYTEYYHTSVPDTMFVDHNLDGLVDDRILKDDPSNRTSKEVTIGFHDKNSFYIDSIQKGFVLWLENNDYSLEESIVSEASNERETRALAQEIYAISLGLELQSLESGSLEVVCEGEE